MAIQCLLCYKGIEVRDSFTDTLTSNMNDATRAYSAEELLPLVYQELRSLAAVRLGQSNPRQTLQPTALVHEVYLKLVGPRDRPQWANKAHFFAAASEAMRQIVIDVYRRKQASKRGGGQIQRSPIEVDHLPQPSSVGLLRVNEAIDALQLIDPQKATLVKLRYFWGMTMSEAAAALDVSIPTAERYWNYSKAYMAKHLKDTMG